MAHRLAGVAVKENPTLAAQRANLSNRLQCSQFVVGVHHRNQDGVGAQSTLQLVQLHNAVGIDADVGDFEARACH